MCCTPNQLLAYQANVRRNLDRFCDAALAAGPTGEDPRQTLCCIGVELIMRAGMILGAAANCQTPEATLAPIDQAMREYQRLAVANGGLHIVIVEKKGGE